MHSEPTYKKERNLLLLHLGVYTLAAYIWWDTLQCQGQPHLPLCCHGPSMPQSAVSMDRAWDKALTSNVKGMVIHLWSVC